MMPQAFELNEEEIERANKLSADINALLRDYMNESHINHDDAVHGSVLAIVLLRYAWTYAALGRLRMGQPPRPEVFGERAKDVAERNPIGKKIMKYVISKIGDKYEWRVHEA